MKINKIIFGLALVAGGLFSSCNTDVEGTYYTPTTQNVSFQTEEPGQILTDDASYTIPVRVVRSDVKTAYTAHYTLESADAGIFTDAGNGTVNFAAGQGVAVVNIQAANMTPGQEYSAVLTLSDADAALADTITNNAIFSTTLSIKRNFVWETIGTATFVSGAFEDSWSQTVLHAVGSNIYRLPDLYEKGLNVDFKLNSDNTVTVASQYAWNDSQYGKAYVRSVESKGASYTSKYDPATGKLSLILEHYVSAGSFGAYLETITIKLK